MSRVWEKVGSNPDGKELSSIDRTYEFSFSTKDKDRRGIAFPPKGENVTKKTKSWTNCGGAAPQP